MKNKISVKMSKENLGFYKRMNVNLIKSDKATEILSYSDLQEMIVKYFKLNNSSYLELLDMIGEAENKNGD